MRYRWTTLLITFILCAGFGSLSVAQTGGASDPKAMAIANQVMDAMGGKESWDNTRYIRFTFFGFRTHHWDKWTGRYRVEWKDRRSGDANVVLMNLNTKEGDAYVNGKKAEGETLANLLRSAQGAWINDTYWLLMPYKLQDPGVTLKYDGEETMDGVTYDKLHLSFDNVGRTPGDEYWAYINRETHLMDQWRFLLQPRGEEGKRSEGIYKWNRWQKYGNVMISPEREGTDGNKRELQNIAVFETLSDAVFTSPEPVDMD
jgi:hypothetical protein